jgi:hypothetical protein
MDDGTDEWKASRKMDDGTDGWKASRKRTTTSFNICNTLTKRKEGRKKGRKFGKENTKDYIILGSNIHAYHRSLSRFRGN